MSSKNQNINERGHINWDNTHQQVIEPLTELDTNMQNHQQTVTGCQNSLFLFSPDDILNSIKNSCITLQSNHKNG